MAPGVLPGLTGLSGQDALIFRLAGAATVGYAAAGVLQFRARTWGEIRYQNLAAIVFNGLSVIAAVAAVMAGGASIVVLLILIAAAGFTASLSYGQWRAGAMGRRFAA